MDDRLDWYTTRVREDGSQEVHIRSIGSQEASKPVYLNKEQTRLFMRTLDHLANDTSIPWAEARQAVLRAFAETLTPSK
ncbi:hypothetical protein RZS28_19935 (plasmid) [Methylocapsa polymorpha]|uniref:Uncharacterized protein n=1 Tax=Methylocapsa polymorpha TaxID=3080828 RepID=A0ABZ0HY41_9HYPH|nr:hypothetical protein [Methylocapsa sp. RX1]WOJ91716.1 hypothetical protein RZS28_19935 [Methylocapsa sp. RX1]